MHGQVNTEEDTSAKESTVGSPPPRKRKRKLSASKRTASSSRAETQKESGTRFMSKGKDIKDLQRDEARKRGIDEEELHTPKKVKKTHASSLYGELQRQQKSERAEARKQIQESRRPIVFGGRGQGKGGRRKGLPKKDAGKAQVTEAVSQKRLSWQDLAAIRALAGLPPPGARDEASQEDTQSDSEGVVPHSARIKRKAPAAQGAPQQVPQAHNHIVQQAIVAGNQARNRVNQAPRHYRRRPGTRALQEMHLIGYFDNANMATIHAKHVTVMVKDMKLVGCLRHPMYGGQCREYS